MKKQHTAVKLLCKTGIFVSRFNCFHDEWWLTNTVPKFRENKKKLLEN